MTLSEYFRNTFPGANTLTNKEYKAHLSTISMRSGNHRKDDGSRFFSRTFFKDLGTSYASFSNGLSKCSTFYVDKCGNKSKRQTHAYYFTETAKIFLINYASGLDNYTLLPAQDNRDINAAAVKDYMLSTQDIDKAVECAQFLIAHSKRDLLDIEYKKHECGRMYAVGNYTIQRMPRWLRKIAFAGWWDYDMKNALVSIACHFVHLPTMEEYNKNTYEIRKCVAADCGVREDAFKKALLSIVFGASHIDQEDTALRKHLGAGNVYKFLKHPFVSEFIKDCAKLQPVLLEKAEELGIKGKTKASTCAQVLMHYENEIIQAATCNLSTPVIMFDV